MQIAILGRQPEISLAELESLYKAESITPVSDYAALVKLGEPLPQARLGGTIKSAKLLTRLKDTDLEGAFTYLRSSIPDHLSYLPEGKLQFGTSIYGFKAQKNWHLRQMLELKKIVRKNGRSVRIIENKSEELEAAQILYNKLTGPLGWELLIIKDGADVILAQTYAVQDIDAYAARDHGRPMRDARVGMLPPKLAQILVNLAVGEQLLDISTKNKNENISKIQDLRSKICILDPFCGTGVILQEALLMGYDAIGTDISERMVEYSKDNLKWLTGVVIPGIDRESSQINRAVGTQNQLDPLIKSEDDKPRWSVKQADATTHQWDFSKIQDLSSKIFIACETYLGEPYSSPPDPQILEKNISAVNKLHEEFLLNVADQTKSGFRMCLAVPAWNTQNSFKHLKVLEKLGDLGYNRLEFAHAKKRDLIYHREDQIVGRELVILQRV